jgi:hypothetical protein
MLPGRVSMRSPTQLLAALNAPLALPRGPRVSFFMNGFWKLGFIDYPARDALQVHSFLLNVVLHD